MDSRGFSGGPAGRATERRTVAPEGRPGEHMLAVRSPEILTRRILQPESLEEITASRRS